MKEEQTQDPNLVDGYNLIELEEEGKFLVKAFTISEKNIIVQISVKGLCDAWDTLLAGATAQNPKMSISAAGKYAIDFHAVDTPSKFEVMKNAGLYFKFITAVGLWMMEQIGGNDEEKKS